MIRMALVLLAIFASVTFAASKMPDCTLADARVEDAIKQKAAELNGHEYCQFRRYDAMDDLNRDGVDDLLVLFTVEGQDGGNDHVDFLSVFLSGKTFTLPITVKVGNRGQRDPVSIEVRDDIIILETQEWQKGDAACCPTGKGEIRLKLSDNRLEPVR